MEAGLSSLYNQLLQGKWMILSADRIGANDADNYRNSALAFYNLRCELRDHGYGWVDARLILSRSPNKFAVGKHLIFICGVPCVEVLMMGARYAYAHQAVLWGDQGRFARFFLDKEELNQPLNERVSDWFVGQPLDNQNDSQNEQSSISLAAGGPGRLKELYAERQINVFCLQRGGHTLGVDQASATYSLTEAKNLDLRSLTAYLPFHYLAASNKGIVSR